MTEPDLVGLFVAPLERASVTDMVTGGVAGWVEDDFRAYLRCGIVAHGFAPIRCDDCAAERLVAFSYRGRGAFPSCTHGGWSRSSPT